MKHPEDGPLDEKVAKGRADAILAKGKGQSAEHAASQKAERINDPDKQSLTAGPGPEWSQHGDAWVHEAEG